MLKTYFNTRGFYSSLIIIALFLFSGISYAQNNSVAIGSTDVRNDAVLWLVANGQQGLILPITTRSGFTPSEEGMLIYDSSDKKIYYWDASAWIEIGAGSGGGADQTLTYNASTGILTISGSNSTADLTLSGDITGTLGSTQIAAGSVGLLHLGNMNLDGGDVGNILQWDGNVWTTVANTGGGGTDDQTIDQLSLNGTNLELSLEDDGQVVQTVDLSSLQDGVNDADSDPANEAITDFSLAGTTLSISENSTVVGTVDLAPVIPPGGTDDQTIDQLSLNGTNLELSLESDGQPVQTVDLSSLGGTDSQNLIATDGGTSATIDISGGTDVTLIEGTNVTLDVAGNNITINSTGGAALPVTSNAQILVNNGTSLVATTVGGDATIDNLGAITLANSAGTRTNLGLGALATLDAVTSAEITDGTIVGADIASSTVAPGNIAPNGTTRSFLATTTVGNVSWIAPTGNNQVLGSDGTGDLFFRPVVDAGTGIASPGSDSNLVTEAAVSAAIAGATSLQGSYDGGNTIQLAAANNLDITKNDATPLMTLEETSGFVGIGTNSPSSTLDVNGTISVSNAYDINGFEMIRTPGNETNISIGESAGSSVIASQFGNVFVGGSAGAATTNGGNNIFVGMNSGVSNISGGSNTFIGGFTGVNNQTGGSNVFLGFNAGFAYIGSSANILIGRNSGAAGISGDNNTFIGHFTGQTNTSGDNITLLGSLTDAVDGLTNATAIGANALVNTSNTMRLGVDGTAIEFNGALIPNADAGTVGQVLTSAGPGATPIWSAAGAAPTLQNAYDGASAIIMTAAQDIDIQTSGGTRSLYIEETTGNVGIGFPTATVPERLTVWDGNIQIGADIAINLYTNYVADNVGTNWATGVENLGSGDFIISNATDLSDPLLFIGGDAGAFDGNVGIGNSNPLATLHVGENAGPGILGDESIYMARDGGDTYLETYSNDMSEGLLMHGLGGGDASGVIKQMFSNGYMIGKPLGLHIINRGAEDIIFSTTDTERMRIAANGNVGINSSNPTNVFEVRESLNQDLVLSVNGRDVALGDIDGGGAGANLFIDGDGAGNFQFNGGNVGIGTASPEEALHISQTNDVLDGTDGTFINLQNSTSLNGPGQVAGLRFRTDGVGAGLNARYKGGVLFQKTGSFGVGNIILATTSASDNSSITAADAKMTILSTGEIGVGTAAPNTRFHVNSVTGEDPFRIQVAGATRFFVDTNGNTIVGGFGTPNQTLDVRGTIGSSGTLYHSDIRWKKDVNQLNQALSKVLDLRGVTYNWRTDEEEFYKMKFQEGLQIGFIAQEVEKVIPELVDTGKDGYKSVKYANIAAILVEATKEQQTIIEAQGAEIAQLKKELTAIKATKATLSKDTPNEELETLKAEIAEIKTMLGVKASRTEK